MKLDLVLSLLAIIGLAQALTLPFSFLHLRSASSEELHQLDARETAKAATDRLLFKASLTTFTKARNSKKPASLNWASDGCSKAPDKPLGFDFLPRCRRHDFGYRNYKKQKRLSEKNRKKIDDKFKADLYAYCKKFTGLQSYKGVACRRTADIYYKAVRAAGDGRVFGVKL
ncbi:hypothetical protein BJ508DRAFT_320424 [Ascobolus immersus RN42]|uniref:Secretory phospholipase A2 n=1 Tax=Ascobolus immersus RN42 TaxID=1160509 RepID=A0A3N4J0G9_ASCIM|nr:hypothetical protein BJ508DRAFT_320424 [Ascobolus immersus RN42]